MSAEGRAEVITVWVEDGRWRWSAWTSKGFRHGGAVGEPSAWQRAREAVAELERTDAVAGS